MTKTTYTHAGCLYRYPWLTPNGELPPRRFSTTCPKCRKKRITFYPTYRPITGAYAEVSK